MLLLFFVFNYLSLENKNLLETFSTFWVVGNFDLWGLRIGGCEFDNSQSSKGFFAHVLMRNWSRGKLLWWFINDLDVDGRFSLRWEASWDSRPSHPIRCSMQSHSMTWTKVNMDAVECIFRLKKPVKVNLHLHELERSPPTDNTQIRS